MNNWPQYVHSTKFNDADDNLSSRA